MTTTSPATPGQLVRAAREQAGLTQRQLAEQMGVGQPSVANLEIDRRGVTVERLQAVATALGVPLRVSLGAVTLVLGQE